MLLVSPIRELIRAVPLLLGLLLANRASSGPPWSLLAVVAIVGRGVLEWFTTRYRITATELELKRGLLRRTTRKARLDRVRTVDLSAHPLQRVLGLVRVEIGTGTNDRRKEAFALAGVRAADGDALRTLLLHRGRLAASAAGDGGEAPSPAELESVLVRFDPRWIRYAPATLSGVVTALFLAGLGWRVVNEADLHPDRVAVIDRLVSSARSESAVVLVAGVVAAIVAIVVVLSVAGYVVAFWGFRLTRHGAGTLHATYGLLTRRATTIEERRLRGVELSEPLLLRAVGGARCLAIATGLRVGRGAERGGTLLLPPAPRELAAGVASAVLGDPAAVAIRLRARGPAALRRRLARAAGPAVVVTAAAVAGWVAGASPGWLALVAVAAPVAASGLAVDRFRSLGYAVTGGERRLLVTRRGSLVRRRAMLDRDGVIGLTIRRSFFQRRAGLASVVATTAAGQQGYGIPDLPASELPALLEDLLLAFPSPPPPPAEAYR
jgi:putative membrane protein